MPRINPPYDESSFREASVTYTGSNTGDLGWGDNITITPNTPNVTPNVTMPMIQPPSLLIQFGTCYACGLEEEGVEVICGVCQEAIKLVRQKMMQLIQEEIEEIAAE